MPKSIIREYDNSTTGSTLSSNFAVVVPGFCGSLGNISDSEKQLRKNEAKKAGIYFAGDEIYKLTSQAQFERYIGKRGEVIADPVGPTLEPAYSEAYAQEGSSPLARFQHPVTASTIFDYFKNDQDKTYKYYIAKEITVLDPNYAALSSSDGYLHKNFVIDSTPVTYQFEEADLDDIYTELKNSVDDNPTQLLYKINIGNEGSDARDTVDHLGNRIAYELLGLGYTVYFKVITNIDDLKAADFWKPLKNKSTYRFRYLMAGGDYRADVAAQMVNIANFNNDVSLEDADTYNNECGRGDCVALLDIDESNFDSSWSKNAKLEYFGNKAKALPASRYAAIFAPRVVYNLPAYDNETGDVFFPGSFHYLACAAQAQSRYAEWYAVAGYTRGICPLSVAYTTWDDIGDIDVNTLAPRKVNTYTDRAINLVLNERGNYYLWGNRTSAALDNDGLIFSHFLNIRQLCCTLKQVLYEASRKFTFDPNSDLLWVNFVNAIRPTLEKMKGDQGIRGYKISKVATDKKALLVAKIRIVPIEALEDFDISVYLEDSLEGITISANETLAD